MVANLQPSRQAVRSVQEAVSSAARCVQSSVLALFGFNATRWASTAAIQATLNNAATWDQSVVGAGFVLEGVLGGLTRTEAGGVQTASALALTYLLAGNETYAEAKQEDPAAAGWEAVWLDAVEVRSAPEADPNPRSPWLWHPRPF